MVNSIVNINLTISTFKQTASDWRMDIKYMINWYVTLTIWIKLSQWNNNPQSRTASNWYSLELICDIFGILRVVDSWLINLYLYVWPQLSGTIVAPKTKSEYIGSHLNTWLGFSSVNGLIISGRGTIDGRGSAWWQQPCLGNPSPVSN